MNDPIYSLAGFRIVPLPTTPGPFVLLTTASLPERPQKPDERMMHTVGMTPKQARDLARYLNDAADSLETTA